MRKLSRLILFFLFQIIYVRTNAQINIQLDSRVATELKQVDAKRPGLTAFGRKEGERRYINMAVLDASSQQLKWFTCYGAAFDSVTLEKDEYKGLLSGRLDPFTFYRDLCNENLSYLKRAEALYRLRGEAALKDTFYNNWLVFNSAPVIAAKSTLQKLMAMERLMKRIYVQQEVFNSRSPREWAKQASGGRPHLAGAMIKRTDSTEYYNIDPMAAVHRIVLHRQRPDRFFVYDHEGTVIDSVPLKPGKYVSLLKEKEDAFLLYRGWLELQWQEAADNRQQLATWMGATDTALYRQVSGPETWSQVKLVAARIEEQQTGIDQRINSLLMPQIKYVEQSIAGFHDNTVPEISYLQGLGFAYTSSYQRGQKRYELAEHRDNVMAVVSDRKNGVDGNGDNVIEYYNADVISANDYYPFGMLQPGRTFSNDQYRYGFNGKENDSEVKGPGGQQDYGMRIYDPRLGKFLSVDPLSRDYPWNSTYAFAENDVIRSVDLDGLEKALVLYGKVKDGNGVVKITVTRVTDVKQAPQNMQIVFNQEPFSDPSRYVLRLANEVHVRNAGELQDWQHNDDALYTSEAMIAKYNSSKIANTMPFGVNVDDWSTGKPVVAGVGQAKFDPNSYQKWEAVGFQKGRNIKADNYAAYDKAIQSLLIDLKVVSKIDDAKHININIFNDLAVDEQVKSDFTALLQKKYGKGDGGRPTASVSINWTTLKPKNRIGRRDKDKNANVTVTITK